MAKSKIKISVNLKTPLLTVWQLWTSPSHIIHWNFATSDWQTPSARVDLRVGGKFNYRMETKDGSMGFDFEGIFTAVVPLKRLEYSMSDDRHVCVTFDEKSDQTIVTEEFEPEDENSLELQEMGWQAILNNFKTYTESYKGIDLCPCIWYVKDGHTAATFYTTVFKPSRILAVHPLTTEFELKGNKFIAMNGGTKYHPNPSISFMVSFNDESELESSWTLLTQNGEIILPLSAYPWSSNYGCCLDQYGVCWQLIKSVFANTGQNIAASFMFTNSNAGKADEAMPFYTGIFPHSYIHSINRYGAGEEETEGHVKHGIFILSDKVFTAMDNSSSDVSSFSEGISIVIPCDNQAQIDYYWSKLADGGTENTSGWLKDKYGVSWQVVPSILGNLLSDQDKSTRVMQALLKMKKIDIDTLLKA